MLIALKSNSRKQTNEEQMIELDRTKEKSRKNAKANVDFVIMQFHLYILYRIVLGQVSCPSVISVCQFDVYCSCFWCVRLLSLTGKIVICVFG